MLILRRFLVHVVDQEGLVLLRVSEEEPALAVELVPCGSMSSSLEEVFIPNSVKGRQIEWLIGQAFKFILGAGSELDTFLKRIPKVKS